MISLIVPLTNLLILSTYCGFIEALSFSSSIRLKNPYSSDPLKCLSTSGHSIFLSKLPRFGINLLPKICKAVDFPIPLVPTSPRT
jgi:hypothetical protein